MGVRLPRRSLRQFFAFILKSDDLTMHSIDVTGAGRAYLLLQNIIDCLHVEGGQATFTITPEMADELAAFGSESEDLEDDDPAEESEPDEDGHDYESDVWLRRIRPTNGRSMCSGRGAWSQ
jgi:hypothetical protein